jgi:RHS repeat-associated protein
MKRIFNIIKILIIFLVILSGCQDNKYIAEKYETGYQFEKIMPKKITFPQGSESNVQMKLSSAWNIFDRDTNTSYESDSLSPIEIHFHKIQKIQELRYFGNADSITSVKAKEKNIAFTTLDNIRTNKSWNTLAFSNPVITDVLTIMTVENIHEVEFWANYTELENKKVYENKQTVSFQATPSNFTLAKESVARVKFDLSIPPSAFAQAFLHYESNIAGPPAIIKKINGYSQIGGMNIPYNNNTVMRKFREEINTRWLQYGKNTISFKNHDAAFSMKNIHIEFIADSGYEKVLSISKESLFDRDTSSSSKIEVPDNILINFISTVSPSKMHIFLNSEQTDATGKLTYSHKNQWKDVPEFTLNFINMQKGWNSIALPDGIICESLKISLSGKMHKLELNEIRIASSPAGSDVPRIVVSYPTDGRFFGRTAYIQGFVSPMQSAGTVNIEGVTDERNAADGSFCIKLTKNQTSFANQKDEEPWNPIVRAFVDGKLLEYELDLFSQYIEYNNNLSSAGEEESTGDIIDPDGTFRTTLEPGEAKSISFQNVQLNIPAGAVNKSTEISIIPLEKNDLEDLDPGMVNVTFPAAGYRFLPHAKFEKPVEIYFKYASELLKQGQKDEDIFMFYFDIKNKTWKRLNRINIEKDLQLVRSVTNNFGDIINATLTVPENPNPLLYNPNSIKNLKSASPTTGINLIEPPTATNMGDANLNYPIVLPKGRNGVEPSLAVQYSSGGGNGIMGLGWNIPVRSVSIDTAFGVPRYKDEEVYLLEGMKLVPDPQKKGFYKQRIEGAFNLIERKGDGPDSYHWKVTDKSGKKYIYGKSPVARLSNPSTANNNIFQWYLEKVIDIHGNNIKYYYWIDNVSETEPGREVYLDKITYTGTEDSDGLYSVHFSYDQDRPDRIVNCRSGFKMTTRYKLNAIDVVFDNSRVRRYEFKYKTGAFEKLLLEEIQTYGEIGSNGTGYFYKHNFEYYDEVGYDPERKDISLNGFSNSGNAYDILSRLFNYNSDLGTNLGGGGTADLFVGYSPPVIGGRKDTSVGARTGSGFDMNRGKVELADVNGDGLPDRMRKNSYIPNTTLDESSSISWGNEIPISNLGPSLDDNKSWRFTIGGSAYFMGIGVFSDYNMGETSSSRYLMDINADGRVDIITGNNVMFNNAKFVNGNEVEAKFEHNSIMPIGASKTSADISELPDDPEWEQDQENLKKHIDEEALSKKYYRDNPVRMWQAPFDGFVNITGNVSLFTENMEMDTLFGKDTKNKIDGVFVSIQKERNVLWFKEISPSFEEVNINNTVLFKPVRNTVTPGNVNGISVDKGDRIFFRVDSINDGSYDVVHWDPVIEYVNTDTSLEDENGFTIYRFQASKDFNLAGSDLNVTASHDGKIDISGDIYKIKKITDDITAKIIIYTPEIDENGNPTSKMGEVKQVFSEKIKWDENDVNSPVRSVKLKNIQVIKNDIIKCQIFSDSTIDWTQISWKPVISYSSIITNRSMVRTDPGTGKIVVDEEGNPEVITNTEEVNLEDNEEQAIKFFAPVSINHYPILEGGPVRGWDVTPDYEGKNTTLRYSVMLYQETTPFSGEISTLGTIPDGYKALLSFAVKRKTGTENRLLVKNNFIVRKEANKNAEIVLINDDNTETPFSGNMAEMNLDLPDLNEGDKLFFVFTTQSSDLLKYISYSNPEITNPNLEKVKSLPRAVLYSQTDDNDETILFSGGFRNWYYGRWNGEKKTDGQNKLDPDCMVIKADDFKESTNEISGDKINDLAGKTNDTDKFTDIVGNFTNTSSILEKLKTFSPMVTEANYYRVSDPAYSNIKKWQKKGPSELDKNNIPINMSVYTGNDSDTWISATMMSSTRIIKKNISSLESDIETNNRNNSDQNTLEQIDLSPGYGRGIKRSTKQTGFVVGADVYGNLNITKNFMKTSSDMFDFNGDSYPDTVKNGHVRFTNSDGSIGPSKRIHGFTYVRESESSNYTMGISWGVDGTLQKTSYMATGRIVGQKADFSSPGISLMAGHGTTKSKSDFIDINGDGLPDRIHNDGSVQLNMGYRLGAKETLNLDTVMVNKTANINTGGSIGFSGDKGAYGGGVFINSSQAGIESAYIDINGDGLPDRLEKSLWAVPGVGIIPKNNILKVRFNTGKGFTEEYHWDGGAGNLPLSFDMSADINTGGNFSIKIPLFALFIPLGYIIVNPGIGADVSHGKAEVSMIDINGDGNADHVFAGPDGSVMANLNRTGKTNLLRKVTRPMGSFKISYNRKGNTVDMPQSRWVMKSVTLNDGMSEIDTQGHGGVHIYITDYAYKDGYYDHVERDFYGFRTLVSKTGSGTDAKEVIRTFLNKVNYEKGLEVQSVLKDSSGRIYKKNINEYKYREICDKSRFTYLKSKESHLYEGETDDEHLDGRKSLLQEFKYDDYGNIAETINHGEPGDINDDITTKIEYDLRPSQYIMNNPEMIRILGSDGSLLRARKGIYDNKGNLRQEHKYLDGTTYSVTNIDYYENGTKSSEIYPANEIGERYYVKYYYDPRVMTYVVRTEDAFGLSSSTVYDYRYGLPLSRVDTNNNLMMYSYDEFGRPSSVWGPYDTGSDKPTVEYVYNHRVMPAYAKTMNKEHRDSLKTIDVAVFTDGLGRKIQIQKTHEKEGITGRSISGRVIFDSHGRIVEQGQPEFINDKIFKYIKSSPVFPIKFTLDLMDRKTGINYPDGTSERIDYGFSTDSGMTLFSTLLTDKNGEKKESLKDIRGLIKKVIEYTDSDQVGKVNTTYIYNALKEITSVTDHEGNETIIDYDMAGRRTSISNPDSGVVNMFYDASGNLTRKITPNLRAQSKSIRYTYHYNRLSKINYPNMPDVDYIYGSQGDSWNRAGRITTVDNGTLKEEFYYGQLGETVKSVRSIKTSNGVKTFSTRFEWDNLGKMKKLYYPDGEVLFYKYNTAGQLKSAVGYHREQENVYVKDIMYDQFGDKKKITLGNGVTTTYEYYPENRRLKNLKTESEDGKIFQNIRYKFDDAGNLKNKMNNKFLTSDGITKNSEQSYKYDSLNRLISSEGSYKHERLVPMLDKTVNSYTNKFTYNPTGNIRTKTQIHTGVSANSEGTRENASISKTTYDHVYSYDSSRPHAVTAVGPKSFTYDASGNMTVMRNSETGSSRLLKWDDENRLIRSNDSYGKSNEVDVISEDKTGDVTTYNYDSVGKRVVKSGRFGEVVYVNSNYTVRNDALIGKHVFAGGIRVASMLMMEKNTDNAIDNNKNIYYYHGSRHGATTVVTNKHGQFHEHIEFFPFGETWIHEKSNDDEESKPYNFTGKEQDPETGLYYYGARYYDPVISRWTGVDPVLNEYLDGKLSYGGIYRPGNLDLYSYAGNNPVKYSDPDGKTIKIKGSKSYAEKVLKTMQKLDPSARMDENNFIYREKGLEGLKANIFHPKGHRLIKSLVDSRYNTEIREGTYVNDIGWFDGPAQKQNGNRLYGVGSHNTVIFNPVKPISTPVYIPKISYLGQKQEVLKKVTQPEIVLGHELIHSLHTVKGRLQFDREKAYYKSLSGNMHKDKPEEISTVGFESSGSHSNYYYRKSSISENDLRRELGYPLRDHY